MGGSSAAHRFYCAAARRSSSSMFNQKVSVCTRVWCDGLCRDVQLCGCLRDNELLLFFMFCFVFALLGIRLRLSSISTRMKAPSPQSKQQPQQQQQDKKGIGNEDERRLSHSRRLIIIPSLAVIMTSSWDDVRRNVIENSLSSFKWMMASNNNFTLIIYVCISTRGNWALELRKHWNCWVADGENIANQHVFHGVICLKVRHTIFHNFFDAFFLRRFRENPPILCCLLFDCFSFVAHADRPCCAHNLTQSET